jgi:cytochrome c oxidase subunit 3
VTSAAFPMNGAPAPETRPAQERLETAEFGMWVFLATEVLFFGALFVAYGFGRVEQGEGWALAARRTDVVLGTLNTAILLTSSAFVAAAVAAVEHDRARFAARCLWVTVVLGIAFAAIKGIEWQHEWRDGLFPGPGFALTGTSGAELFFIVYFVVTGLHAVHLVIGIVLVGAFAIGTGRGAAFARPPRLQVAALYWHFVDIVWIFLYPLLYLVARNG